MPDPKLGFAQKSIFWAFLSLLLLDSAALSQEAEQLFQKQLYEAAVPKFQAELAAHPDLAMDVILDDRLIDLVEEGVDVALRMGTLADSFASTPSLGWCA